MVKNARHNDTEEIFFYFSDGLCKQNKIKKKRLLNISAFFLNETCILLRFHTHTDRWIFLIFEHCVNKTNRLYIMMCLVQCARSFALGQTFLLCIIALWPARVKCALMYAHFSYVGYTNRFMSKVSNYFLLDNEKKLFTLNIFEFLHASIKQITQQPN